ncbi:hypothetical protein [Phaeodactylibacter xiamenensis]|uniref:hypothetical protein n=1 Tax=Phaeodactylibacter xiamenensis TaxID=1524460 RepID=UPI003CCB91F5
MIQHCIVSIIAIFIILPVKSKCQTIFIQIEEISYEDSSRYMGGGNFVFTAQYPLRDVLYHCLARTGSGISKDLIELEKAPLIRIKAGSKSELAEYALFHRIAKELMNRYNLELQLKQVEKKTLIFRSVEQAPSPNQKNSGTELHSNGDVTLSNASLSTVCWWLGHHGVGLRVDQKELLDDIRVTLDFPAETIAQMPDNISSIQHLLNNQGVICELVKEPIQIPVETSE